MTEEKKRVAIVGAGLVGSLEACYLAKRGYLLSGLVDSKDAALKVGRQCSKVPRDLRTGV